MNSSDSPHYQINTIAPGEIVHAAASQGYQISPGLVRVLSQCCEYQATVMLCELIRMFPDEQVFDLHNLSEVMGIVIIEGVEV